MTSTFSDLESSSVAADARGFSFISLLIESEIYCKRFERESIQLGSSSVSDAFLAAAKRTDETFRREFLLR